MLIKRRQHDVPELNTTSTADISFMLLIFFLVTTSMNIDKGLKRLLPAPEPPNEEINDKEIERENIFNITITADNRLLHDDETISAEQLSATLIPFITEKKDKHIVSITIDAQSNYNTYFRLQNALLLIYRQMRNDYLQQKYGATLLTATPKQAEEAFAMYPQRIAENVDSKEGGRP